MGDAHLPHALDERTRDSEVVVIGGGVLGVSCAYYLAKAGVAVTLVERGGLASGASYGNAGWIFPSHSTPLPGPGVAGQAISWLLDPSSPLYIRPSLRPSLLRFLWRFWRACDVASAKRTFALNRELSLESLACYETLAALAGLDFGYRQSGLVLVCESQKGLDGIAEEIEWLEALGGKAERLDARGLRALEPSLGEEICGGAFLPADAMIHPADFVHQLAGAAVALGARIAEGIEVIGARRVNGRVTLDTTRGSLRADQAILAAGVWSAPLAAGLGASLPIEAAKGYSLAFERPASFGQRPLMLVESKVGVTPMGPVLRFAGTLELAGIDLRIRPRRVRAIRSAAERHLPGLRALEPLEVWRGLRPCTPDDLPILGRLAVFPELIVAGGHGMSGISQGPVSGKLAAQLARGETPDLALDAFSPARFGA